MPTKTDIQGIYRKSQRIHKQLKDVAASIRAVQHSSEKYGWAFVFKAEFKWCREKSWLDHNSIKTGLIVINGVRLVYSVQENEKGIVVKTEYNQVAENYIWLLLWFIAEDMRRNETRKKIQAISEKHWIAMRSGQVLNQIKFNPKKSAEILQNFNEVFERDTKRLATKENLAAIMSEYEQSIDDFHTPYINHLNTALYAFDIPLRDTNNAERSDIYRSWCSYLVRLISPCKGL